MDDDLGLLHGAEDVAAHDGVADMHGGEEVPFCVALQRGDLHAALQVVAGDPHDRVQRALDAVVDRADQARPELDAHRLPGGFDGRAGAEAGGLLVNLDRRLVAVDLYDFADQPLVADAHDVEHVRVAHAAGNDERTGYFFDCAFAHLLQVTRFC